MRALLAFLRRRKVIVEVPRAFHIRVLK